MMLKYRCRILFTTRSRYENHISLEVGELNPDTLLELVSKFFPEAEKKQDEISQIIELLHGHTFAVELTARLLANGLLKPKALVTKLQKEKAALDADDKIGTTKDGRNRKATYYDHIHSLFSFYKLAGSEQEITHRLEPSHRKTGPFSRLKSREKFAKNRRISTKTGLTKKQKVTEVYYNTKDPTAEVYSRDTNLKKRMRKYAEKFPELCKQTDDDGQGGLRFKIDKSRISIRLTAPYSDDRRKAASELEKKRGIHNQ